MEIPEPTNDEPGRIAALKALDILDTPPEERFDKLTRLARERLGVPIAAVSLVDRDRQWFKSRQGLDATETPRSVSFCGHAIHQDNIFVVEDTRIDPRFSDNPLVTGEPFIRFYAGCPIRSADGFKLGTLCVIDTKPRHLSQQELDELRKLALMAEAEIRSGTHGSLGAGESLEPSGYLQAALASALAAVSRPLGAAILALLTFSFLATIVFLSDRSLLASSRHNAEKTLIRETSILRSNLESSLNAKLYLVHGLSGMVHANRNISQESFEQFAQELGQNVHGLKSLQLAPDAVVTYVWPRDPNAAAVGHNLLGEDNRRRGAEKAIAERNVWMVGPLKLIQGGTALIARLPIFLEHEDKGGESFWGFATILLDVESVLEEIGVGAFSQANELAIRSTNILGQQGQTFYGDSSLFNGDAFMLDLMLPSGSWQIAARPRGGWAPPGEQRLLLNAIKLAGSMVLAFLIYLLARSSATLREKLQMGTQKLTLTQGRFRDAVEALPDGFVVFDADDRLALCNANFAKMYNLGAADVAPGSSFTTLLDKMLATSQIKAGRDASVDELALMLQHNFLTASDDTEVELRDGRFVNILYRSMRSGGRVGFHRDISAVKDYEIDLIEQKQLAEQASRAKSEFLATVSHEVRTPLNGILGMLELLEDENDLSEERRQMLGVANESAKKLLEIINEILDISRIEANRLRLDSVEFDIGKMVSRLSELFAAEVRNKGISFNLDIDDRLTGLRVAGDEGRLRQIVANLLSNAIKFTEQGEINLRLLHKGEDNGSVIVTVSVSDTGIGFDPALTDVMFEPFQQLDQGADRSFEGTGLGLAISKRLLDLMGGEIWAAGKPGIGAEVGFQVTLPLANKAPATRQEAECSVTTPRDAGLPPVRVLLVEDSPTNQFVVRAMLKDTGYELDAVENGQDAIAAANATSYDIILMDIYLPGMDGITTTEKLRESEQLRPIPVIALTANAMPGDKQRFLNAGMVDYLPKPINRFDLLLALAKHSPKGPLVAA